MSTVIVFLATFGLSVLGSWYATDAIVKWQERRRMRQSIERMKVVVEEYVSKAEERT